MTKGNKVVSNFTPEQLGFTGLDSNPVVQAAEAKRASENSDTLFPTQFTDKVQIGSGNAPIEDYQNAIAAGANFGGSSADIEHTLGDYQPIGEQIGISIQKIGTGVPIKLAEMAGNLAAGIKNLVTGNGDWLNPHTGWNDYFENISKELDEAAPIHSTEAYETGSLGQKLMSSKFWTQDVAGEGLPFLLAQIIGTKGIGAAVGAAGAGAASLAKATNLGEIFQSLPITSRIAMATANKFTTGTVGFLNAASISAMQAKGTANQIEAKLRSNYASQINPETGNYYTPKEIDIKIGLDQSLIEEKTNNTFWATMATELLPSIYASKLFLGPAKTSLSEMNADIVKAVNAGKITLDEIGNGVGYEALKKAGWSEFRKEALHASLIGGPIAMNAQMAIQKYDVDQALAGHRGDIWSSSLGYARQFLDNFTDDEQIKGIVMGSVLGALSAGLSAPQAAKAYNEGLKTHLDSMGAADSLYASNVRTIYKTDPTDENKLILDDNGKPIPDTDKLTKLTFQMLHDKNNWNNQTAAILAGNSDMVTLNEHVALSQSIARELLSGRHDTVDNAREYFKWFHKQRMIEQSKQDAKNAQDQAVANQAKDQSADPEQGNAAAIQTATAMKTGSAKSDADLSIAVNKNSATIDNIFDFWKATERQGAKLNKLGDSAARTRFNESVRRTLFYEAVKRDALTEMIRDKESALSEPGSNREALNQEIGVLQSLHTDSENRSTDFLSKPNELYKEWNKLNTDREELLNGVVDSERQLSSNKDVTRQDGLSRAANTANYRLQEHTAKEGIAQNGFAGTQIGSDGRVQVTGEDGLGTSQFSINQPMAMRAATPIGLKQESQFKAGSEYQKIGRLRDLMEKVPTGEASILDVVGYANDNITSLDPDTRKRLGDLIQQERAKVATDEQKLATIPEVDDDFNFNPEFAELNDSIRERKEALDQSDQILRANKQSADLANLVRTPEDTEHYYNKKFAEKSFVRADNIIANALEEDGSVKNTYTDSRAVNDAIKQVTSMRDAIEDRTQSGDLKGETQYDYLVNRANKVLAQLEAIRNAVEDNKLKRDGIQKAINQREAVSNTAALGFNLDTNSIDNPVVYGIADKILKGKLGDMISQIREVESGNHYEASNAILHAIKTLGTEAELKQLKDAMSEQAEGLVAQLPEIKNNKKLLIGFADSPTLYFEEMFRAMYSGGSHYDESKNGPLSQWKRTNDIDELEGRLSGMTEEQIGTNKENMLNLIRTYKQLAALNRVDNLINSKVDLSKTVGQEITRAGNSDGIVPTTQQEIAMRDGLAWLGSNKEVGTQPFSGWGFLRGIAGTGKTNVTVKWMLDLAGIAKEDILTTAATRSAADVIGRSVGAKAIVSEDLLQGEIPKGTRLIVIDEYARIARQSLLEIEAKIRAHNEALSPADRVRTLILGDPTQINPLTFSNRDITNPVANKDAKNIQVINPLTIVYRSEVSAVNETSDIFQDNPNEVKSINVRADRDINSPLAVGTHTSKSGQDINDIIQRNIQYERINGLTPRSRVIITDQPNKYSGLGVPTISVYDAQSETYDEAYVDLNPRSFPDSDKFNAAMYTAASRAKQYSYIRYDDGTNTADPGLGREQENNNKTGREAKGEYIKDRTEEQTMMDAAAKGKAINVPKTEAAVKVAEDLPPLTKATEPDVPEDTEIVAEVPSSDPSEPLPTAVDGDDGSIDPITDTPIPPVEPLEGYSLLDGEHMLPNIEKGTFEALATKDEFGNDRQSDVVPGSDVHFMYTKEKNGENAITAFVLDKDGNWIPVSKVFQDEIDKHPQYAQWKQAVAGMKPMFSSDPLQLNGSGSRSAYSLDSMKKHLLDSGKVTRTQRMTYQFGNEPVQGAGLAQHIKDIFRKRFFSSRATEQAKADTLHYKIFRNNEIQSSTFAGFTPEVGIPYAIIGVPAGSRNYKGAQFVRLTANKLSQESDHYKTLKSYRDTAKRIETETGITPGTKDFNRVMRSMKKGLEIVDDNTSQGREKKVRLREDFTRSEFISELKKVSDPAIEFEDPTSHLSDEEFNSMLPHMQGLASMIYGLDYIDSKLTPSEVAKAHGEDYEHVPFKKPQLKKVTNEAGEEVEEPLGRVRLKGTGGNTGKAEVKVKHYELSAGKGEAQQALNQLAKANEYVGNVRIRIDANKTVGNKNARGPRPDGKSLLADQGGDTAVYQSRIHLGRMLGEIRVAEGKLDEADLKDKDTRIALEKEIRIMAGNSDKSIMQLGEDLLAGSNLPPERQAELLSQLNRVSTQKDTPPITMSTLDLMVGDENYLNGEHTTADAYTIKGRSGQTKETQTYLRTPLDIDQFNELGKSPEANADQLAKMVGTKFQDLLPTQIAVSRDGIVRTAEPTQVESVEEVRQEPTVPGSKQHLQTQIDEITQNIAGEKNVVAKARLRKEQSRLEAERDASSRMFDENMRRTDKGEKISIDQAKAEIIRLLPNISDNEMEFLNRSMMIEMQRPGESLLGLFQKGKLYFAEQDGTVFSNVVRHEVFHKVFNDYLSPRDRNNIAREFDPQGKMNPSELEEELADRFMTWQTRPETVTGKIKRIFNRILSWIGLARSSGGVEQLFNDINNGKFQVPNGSYPDVRMAFSDIRKYGTVTDYKKAAKYIQGLIKDNFIDDHIENMPVTQSELFDNVRRALEERKAYYDTKIDGMLDEHKELGEAFYATEDPAEKIELQEYIDATEAQINEDNGYLKMMDTLVSGDNLRDMWSDLYPNFKFEKKDIVSFEENEVQEDPEAQEKDESEVNERANGSIAADFVQQSDERNQEGKISQNVKNFLSFIYRPDKFTREEGRVIGDRINPRGVYLQCLRNLSNLQSSDSDFVEQLVKRAAENGINLKGNSDGATIVRRIIDLYHNATGDAYVFTGDAKNGKSEPVRVELDPTRRFLDDNTFVISTDGKDLSQATRPSDTDVVINRNNKSTSQFLDSLVNAGLTMEEAKGYFRRHQAQETLRELMSNFLSQRESTPMIAEEQRGFTTVLKYFRAQNYGIERVKTTELENSFRENFTKVPDAEWIQFEQTKPEGYAGAIANVLKAMGVRGIDSIRGMNSNTIATAYGDLKAFRELVSKYKPEAGENEASDSDETPIQVNPVSATLEKNTGMLDRLTKLLTLNSSESRASSYTDTTGTKRYLFHNGSQAHDTLGKIVRFFGDKIGKLPQHLTDDTVLSKNIFVNGINKIYEILDHDGQRQEGKEEFATGYSGESNSQWLKRNFSDAFLTFAKTNSRDNADPLTYMQNFYTISNRPRMIGARVEILSETRIKDALKKAIEQHVEQPDLTSIKNYDRFKAVNFDELHKALEEHLEGKTVSELRGHTEGRVKLAELYDRVRTDETLKDTIASHIIGQLKTHAEEALQRMKAENVTLGSDVHEAMKLLKDKRRQVLGDEDPTVEASINQRENGWPADEQMRPTVESFYMNNYVNGYFLNQTVAGNMNFFKDGLDMVKRMSGVFAPGTKGMVGDKFFMAKKFNVAISSDPKMYKDMLSPIFKDTKLMETLSAKGFDLADAQGFMLPERAENIVQGFGKAYNAGAVFKPAHYEIAKRTIDGVETYVPVMLKYSSVVLSDDLVSRFPKLEALRAEMRGDGTRPPVHEFIFDSGTKVGAPTEQVKLPKATAYDNNNITIDPESIVPLSGENYRLQLNPAHEAYAKTSNPTQLGYFLNVLHKLSEKGAPNETNANNVYGAIAEKISRGISRLSDSSMDAGGRFKTKAIKDMLNGAGNERLQEMLSSGLSYNMPNIADKAMIQMANLVSKETVKITFPGGKMVLQSSYGVDLPAGLTEADSKFWSRYGIEESQKLKDQARRLEYKEDPKTGRWHAEVLLPMAYKEKANPGDFVLPDGMGFRIPSTELHSSLPLKIAGFYDDKGSNVVIAPAELVAQHGSDFDVDSLYVISREVGSRTVTGRNGITLSEKNRPVGYYTDKGGKLVFNPVRFRNELEEAKQDVASNKKALKQLEKLHDQFLNNQITEGFLDTISHSSNKQRMLTPISTEVISDSFKELGIETGNSVNLSRLLDNLQVFNSNFQGASLVGIFANGMKALSYMSRAGVRTEGQGDAYPQLKEGLEVKWNGKTYSKFGEIDHTGGNLWEELDALVNTSVDNVKEQKLYHMNATDRTGPAYVAAKAIGMPLTESMRLMLQPIVKIFAGIDGGRGTVMPATKAKLLAEAAKVGLIAEGQKYDDLRTAVQDMPEPTQKQLDAARERGSIGSNKEEVAQQFHVLEQFEKINKMGDDLTTFSRAISILQDMPVFYKDIAGKVDQWNKIGQIVDGALKTNEDFSFVIDNLLQVQPNIKAAYDAFTWLKGSVDKSIIKHFPEVTALANKLADTMKIKLVYDRGANVEAIKNEAVGYLVSSYYANELAEQKPVSVQGSKVGKAIVLTGRAAWSQDFAGRVAKAIKDNVSNEQVKNEFLRRIEVQESKYGIKSIQFANASNPDALEAVEMQEGFSAIEDPQLKADFVKYAVLNFGLNFGTRNYSMFIPSELLKPISDFISQDMKRLVESSSLDSEGKLIAGPLKNIADNLAIRMAVNNIEKLPFISNKKIPADQTLDAAGKPMYTKDAEPVPIMSGYNGEYYWHRAYSNPLEGEKRRFSEDDLPQFFRKNDANGRPAAYYRINEVDNDKVYYQRIGYKNYSGGYDAAEKSIHEGYNPEDYFGKGTIPVPVSDVRTGKYETKNEHIVPGVEVIVYPYSNDTREQGIKGIVDKVNKPLGGGDGPFTFTIKSSSEPEAKAETVRTMDIASHVTSKFGLGLTTDEKMNAKGMYKDGIVVLNPKLMTPDTAFHEVSHPLVAAIKQQNPKWYGNLVEEMKSSKDGKAILSKVKVKYPELDSAGHEVEALVTAIGMEAANRLETSSFRSLVKRLMRSVGNMVRGIINEVRTKGGISLETLSEEDMTKLSIGDIADIIAAKDVKLGLDLSKVKDQPQYSKELETPEKGSIMENILARANTIEDPIKGEDGQEGDTYKFEGKDLQRVSKVMDKFTFRDKTPPLGPDGKPMSTIDAIARREADRMFKNVAPGGKLVIDGVEQSKQEFEDSKKKIQLQARVKGDIIHAKIQRYLAVLANDVSKVNELDHRISELSTQVDKLPSAYDWVTAKSVFSKLMDNAGINIGGKVAAQDDKVFSEVKVASDLLGAGKIDLLAQKADGRLRIVDFKTGSRLKDKYSANVLKYGIQEGRITDNPLDRAKLQLMTYALIVKAEHPEAKFDGLVVMHLPNEYEATQGRNAIAVNIPDYLRMMEQYYRHEEPAIYKQLLERSPKIFDPREYNAPRNADFVQDVLNSGGASELETLAKAKLDLQKLIVQVELEKNESTVDPWTRERQQLRQELIKKIAQGNSYISSDFTGALDTSNEISLMVSWLGNIDDSHNPLVQSFSTELNANRQAAQAEYDVKTKRFRELLTPVLKETIGERGLIKKALTWVDKRKAFQGLWEEKETIADDGTKYLSRGLINEDSAGWEQLSPAKKALATYMAKEMKDIFDEVMVNGPNAIVSVDREGKPLTKLSLYNGSERGAQFKYHKGFVPRVAITAEEVAQRALDQGIVSGGSNYIKDRFLRYFTDFFENNVEGQNQKDYGMPVRFLGNGNTYTSPDTYTTDLQLAFEKYMHQMINKKHLDTTWAYGQAVKGLLEVQKDANGNTVFDNSVGQLGAHIENVLVGNKLKKGTKGFSRHGFTLANRNGEQYTISTNKLYRSAKSGVAAATLWAQPVRATKNALQATYMIGKEALVNSIGQHYGGIRAEERDLSYKNHVKSYGEAIGSQWDMAAGKGKANFAHTLAKTLNLYPDIELGNMHENSLTRGATLLNTQHLGFLYQMPEEVTTMTHALDFLKTMTIQTGTYKGKSMYDMYKSAFKVNDAGEGYFELPQDFKRGKIEKADGTFEDLAGLHPLEVRKLQRSIQKLKGGYKADEKTRIQGSILGDAYMMFKRWIPAMAIQQYNSKFTDPSIGQFELQKVGQDLVRRDGEPVYEWRARVVEGRFNTLFNWAKQLTPLSSKDGYAWADMSGEQRKGLIDAAISTSAWLSMLAITMGALRDRDEKDSLKAFTADMASRYFEQWNGLSLAAAAAQPPAVVKTAQEVMKGMWALSTATGTYAVTGRTSDLETNKGDIKGVNLLMKHTPLVSAYYESKKFYDASDDKSIWDSISGY